MDSVVGRGTVLAGRYQLTDPRPCGLPGVSEWTATDQILVRPVVVRVFAVAGAGPALDAARRAALVPDPRLVRVLDVGSDEDAGYVVTEQVNGPTLAQLVSREPLSADQARAVVGEAATALEVARRRGVHHLALRPSALAVSDDGRVLVSGLALDATLLTRPGGDARTTSRTDATDLVRLVYTALTGHWPGSTATSDGLPTAPEADGVPVPPADLVAGVPADLNTLCAVTLGRDDDGPLSPADLVRELEPWGEIRVQGRPRPPVPPAAADPGAHGAATGPGQVVRQSVRSAFTGPTAAAGRPGTPPPAAPETPLASVRDAATPAYGIPEAAFPPQPPEPAAPPVAPPFEPVVAPPPVRVPTTGSVPPAAPFTPAAGPFPPPAGPFAPPGPAGPFPPPAPAGPGSPSSAPTVAAPSAPTTAFPPAPAPSTPTPAAAGGFAPGRRPPAVPPPGPLSAGPGAPTPSSYDAPPQFPPTGEPDPFDFGRIDDEPPRRRTGTAIAIVLVGLLVVVAIAFAAKALFTGHGTAGNPGAVATTSQQSPTSGASGSASAAPSSSGPSASPSPTARPGATATIASIQSIDPSDADGEHQEAVNRAFDGDPSTFWYTMTYKRDDFAGFKPAVGLALTFTEPATVSTVTLHVNGTGGNVEVRSGDATTPGSGTLLASGPMSADTVLTLSAPQTTSSLVLWFTQLPTTADGSFRVELTEIQLG